MKRVLIWSLVGLIVSLTAFICADCACGTTLRYDCKVSGRERIEAWTETSTATDSDGRTRTTTTRHEDEWHLYCAPIEEGPTMDVNTPARVYNTVTNGQAVSVVIRKGRWTGARYLPRIEER